MKILLTQSVFLLVGLSLLTCMPNRSEPERRQTPTPTTARTSKATPNPSLSQPAVTNPAPSAASPAIGTLPALIVPVAGIRAEQLHDTFNEARSEGRVHEAIDIIAPQGTKVLAVTDGKIVKLFTSEKGGFTIYQLSPQQTLVFYYAHLQRYADGLAEQQEVRQGDLLGYVGDTGNAQPGNYHLHFAIWQITNPKDFWNGANLNPYDILKHQ